MKKRYRKKAQVLLKVSADKLISLCFSISYWCPVARRCCVIVPAISALIVKKKQLFFLVMKLEKLHNVAVRPAEKAVHCRLFIRSTDMPGNVRR